MTTSATLPLFYKRVVPLNKEQHGDLCVEAASGYSFASETNSLYIAAVEFSKAAAEYPIVFAMGEIPFPVALLGLKANQNLYVAEDGTWDALYVPAYARRYPFILATPDENAEQFTVCIDEGYSGFNTAKEGEPLFNDEGEQTGLLEQAVNFLKDYQTHVAVTTQLCKNLAELNLLEPVQANIKLASGEDMAMGGFQCVNREKLSQVKPGKLADLVKTGQMELIYTHLYSLNNLNKLMNKMG